jgi:hypothetical protein
VRQNVVICRLTFFYEEVHPSIRKKLEQKHIVFHVFSSDRSQSKEFQNAMGHVDDIPFEEGAEMTNVLGHFAHEQRSVELSPQEADRAADSVEHSASVL